VLMRFDLGPPNSEIMMIPEIDQKVVTEQITANNAGLGAT